MNVDDDEFSDDSLDAAAFEELKVVETEFLRQTQILQGSQNSDSRLDIPCMNQTGMTDGWKDDLEKVSQFF